MLMAELARGWRVELNLHYRKRKTDRVTPRANTVFARHADGPCNCKFSNDL